MFSAHVANLCSSVAVTWRRVCPSDPLQTRGVCDFFVVQYLVLFSLTNLTLIFEAALNFITIRQHMWKSMCQLPRTNAEGVCAVTWVRPCFEEHYIFTHRVVVEFVLLLLTTINVCWYGSNCFSHEVTNNQWCWQIRPFRAFKVVVSIWNTTGCEGKTIVPQRFRLSRTCWGYPVDVCRFSSGQTVSRDSVFYRWCFSENKRSSTCEICAAQFQICRTLS